MSYVLTPEAEAELLEAAASYAKNVSLTVAESPITAEALAIGARYLEPLQRWPGEWP